MESDSIPESTEKRKYVDPYISAYGENTTEEQDIWEFFVKYHINAGPADELVHAKTRKEALLQSGFARHSILTELWNLRAERILLGGRLVHPVSIQLASRPGSNILCLAGWLTTNMHGWILASEYPQSNVVCYRTMRSWPLAEPQSGPNSSFGPSNCKCSVGDLTGYLPYPDASFDVVSSYSCYVDYGRAGTTETLLKEIKRVLKPGGIFEVVGKDISSFVSKGDSIEKILKMMEQSGASSFQDTWPASLSKAGFVDNQIACIGLPCGAKSSFDEICHVGEYVTIYHRFVAGFFTSLLTDGRSSGSNEFKFDHPQKLESSPPRWVVITCRRDDETVECASLQPDDFVDSPSTVTIEDISNEFTRGSNTCCDKSTKLAPQVVVSEYVPMNEINDSASSESECEPDNNHDSDH